MRPQQQQHDPDHDQHDADRFAQAISRFAFKQATTRREAVGIVLIVIGVVLLLLWAQ